MVPIFDNSIGVAAVYLDQSQTGVTIKEIFLKGIITEKLNQQLACSATDTGNVNIAITVEFMQFSQHQIIFYI